MADFRYGIRVLDESDIFQTLVTYDDPWGAIGDAMKYAREGYVAEATRFPLFSTDPDSETLLQVEAVQERGAAIKWDGSDTRIFGIIDHDDVPSDLWHKHYKMSGLLAEFLTTKA